MEASLNPGAAAAGQGERGFIESLRPLVDDLRRHQPWRYWLDFGVNIAAFWASLSLLEVTGPWLQAGCYLVAVFTLYRCAMFIHELSHMPRRAVRGFNLAWNLACGIPLLLPSFLYLSHMDHHTLARYGTRQDPEYLPFERRFASSMATLALGTLLTPLLLWVRFALAGPLSWFVPALRRVVVERYSAVTLHAAYRNNPARLSASQTYNRMLEGLTSLYAWALVATAGTTLLPWSRIGWFLAVIYGVLFINMFRTWLAHRYASPGHPVSLQWQLSDSTTHARQGGWIELLEPLSQRYHAMHHLFPALPYHALKTAHDRVMAADGAAADLYRQTAAAHPAPTSTPYPTENPS